MPSIRAEIIDGFSAKIDAAEPRIRARAEQILEAAGIRMAGRVQSLMKQTGIYSSGELRKSIHSRVTVEGSTVRASVSSNEKYAEAVHEGRKPGTPPPVSALLEWVLRGVRQGRITLSVPQPRSPRRKRSAAQRKNAAARGVAFAIQSKIAKHGIKGRPFFDDTFDLFGKPETARVSRELAAAVRQEVAGG